MKSLTLFLTISLLTACKTPESIKSSSTASISAAAPYYWSSYSSPKILKISQNFNPDEVSNITAMSAAWKSSVDNQKTFFDHTTTKTAEISNTVADLDSMLDNILGIYKTTNWPSELPGSALAVTQLFGRRYNIGSSNEFVDIEHADIMVNYDLYAFDTDETGNGFDLRTVILHEMGHFIGLTHKGLSSAPAASVMYPSVGPSTVKRAPMPVDRTDIMAKYGIASGGVAVQMVRPTKTTGDLGEKVRIVTELHADGKCVHRVNGAVIERHSVRFK